MFQSRRLRESVLLTLGVITPIGILAVNFSAFVMVHLPECRIGIAALALLSGLVLNGLTAWWLLRLASRSAAPLFAEYRMWAIGISCLALFPAAICMLFEAIFVATERAEFQTLGSIIESLLRISLSIAVLQLGYGIMELMWVVVFSRSALLVFYWFSLRSITSYYWKFSYAATRRFVLRWRVFAAENWMAAIYTNLDVLMLSWIAGESAVGLYSAAWKFVRLGAVFSKSFTTAVFPVMSRMYVDSKGAFDKLFRHTIRVMSAIALPVIVSVSVLTDRIIPLLYKEEFADTGPILRILIWVLLLEFLNPFLSHVLFAQEKQHKSMYVAAISLGVNSITIILLVREYGAIGAAIGCIVGGFVATLCYLAFAAKLNELPTILLEIGRVLIAASGLGVAIYLVRDSSWLVVFAVAIVTYTFLLFVVQAIRMNDLRFFQSTFLRRATA